MKKIRTIAEHPRSGYHFLRRALYLNFPELIDLDPPEEHRFENGVVVRGPVPEGVFKVTHTNTPTPGADIYLYRDGRDVMVSMWRSPDFHRVAGWETEAGTVLPKVDRKPFKEWLRAPMPWYEMPRNHQKEPGLTPVEHWWRNITNWYNKAGVQIAYEDLYNEFGETMSRIAEEFDLPTLGDYWGCPQERLGFFPFMSQPGRWNSHFDGEDLDYFFSIVNQHHSSLSLL